MYESVAKGFIIFPSPRVRRQTRSQNFDNYWKITTNEILITHFYSKYTAVAGFFLGSLIDLCDVFMFSCADTNTWESVEEFETCLYLYKACQRSFKKYFFCQNNNPCFHSSPCLPRLGNQLLCWAGRNFTKNSFCFLFEYSLPRLSF